MEKPVTFRSIRSCVHFIDVHCNAHTGEELSINDSLYFGGKTGIYCYRHEAIKAHELGFKVWPDMDKSKNNLYQLSWLEVYEFVKYLNKKDGHLIAQK